MTTLIHDTVIVTGDDNDTVHYGASIAIDGDQDRRDRAERRAAAALSVGRADRRRAARW